jgi:hypothetical protein
MNGQEEQGLRERYFRERRLLLAVSVVLLARQLLGIDVGQSADTLGLHFEIKEPERLWWAVWALWLWSLVCCFQQLNSLRPYIHFPVDRRTSTYLALHRRWARAKILRAVRASFDRQVPRMNQVHCSVGVPTMVTIESTEHAQAAVALRWRTAPEQARAVGLTTLLLEINGSSDPPGMAVSTTSVITMALWRSRDQEEAGYGQPPYSGPG